MNVEQTELEKIQQDVMRQSVIINYEMNLGQSHCVFIKGKYHYLNK